MCLTQYDEEKTMRLLKEEGREEGRKEGENRLIRLLMKLNEECRFKEAKSVLTNAELRKELYKYYKMI